MILLNRLDDSRHARRRRAHAPAIPKVIWALADDLPRPFAGVAVVGALRLREQVTAELLIDVVSYKCEPSFRHRVAPTASNIFDGRVTPSDNGASLASELLPPRVV